MNSRERQLLKKPAYFYIQLPSGKFVINQNLSTSNKRKAKTFTKPEIEKMREFWNIYASELILAK